MAAVLAAGPFLQGVLGVRVLKPKDLGLAQHSTETTDDSHAGEIGRADAKSTGHDLPRRGLGLGIGKHLARFRDRLYGANCSANATEACAAVGAACAREPPVGGVICKCFGNDACAVQNGDKFELGCPSAASMLSSGNPFRVVAPMLSKVMDRFAESNVQEFKSTCTDCVCIPPDKFAEQCERRIGMKCGSKLFGKMKSECPTNRGEIKCAEDQNECLCTGKTPCSSSNYDGKCFAAEEATVNYGTKFRKCVTTWAESSHHLRKMGPQMLIPIFGLVSGTYQYAQYYKNANIFGEQVCDKLEAMVANLGEAGEKLREDTITWCLKGTGHFEFCAESLPSILVTMQTKGDDLPSVARGILTHPEHVWKFLHKIVSGTLKGACSSSNQCTLAARNVSSNLDFALRALMDLPFDETSWDKLGAPGFIEAVLCRLPVLEKWHMQNSDADSPDHYDDFRSTVDAAWKIAQGHAGRGKASSRLTGANITINARLPYEQEYPSICKSADSLLKKEKWWKTWESYEAKCFNRV